MREPGLWLATAGAGLIAFFVGSSLEQDAIATNDNFGGPSVLVAHGIAVALWCVAAFQWRRAPRRRRRAEVGTGLPTWQGYGIALLSVAWLALAAVTWFLAELTSPTLTLSMLGIAIMHLVGGRAVVRQNRRPQVVVPDSGSRQQTATGDSSGAVAGATAPVCFRLSHRHGQVRAADEALVSWTSARRPA